MAFREVKQWVEKWNKSRLASSERDNEPLHTERQTSTDQSQPKPFDVEKWNALLKYDQDIANEAEKLRPLGDKWVDEFARAYLVLNDKQYLPGIVRKIISDAKIEDDERQRWQQQEYQKQEEQKREKQERDQRTSTSGQKQEAAPAHKKSSAGRTSGIILSVLVGVFILGAAGEWYQKWRLHQTLLIAQSAIQKKLPLKYNDDFTLVGVKVGYTDWTYQYRVTIPQIDFDLPAVEKEVRKSVCASDMRAMLNDGVSYIYEYHYQYFYNVIGRFEITSCP